MGYYSEYTVDTLPYTEDFGTVLEAASGYSFEEWGDMAWHAEGKWYDYAAHIEALSKAHPELVITLTKEGEDGEGVKYSLKNGEVFNMYQRGWVRID